MAISIPSDSVFVDSSALDNRVDLDVPDTNQAAPVAHDSSSFEAETTAPVQGIVEGGCYSPPLSEADANAPSVPSDPHPLANNTAAWSNENNAPYGVTLAGFSPGDHVNFDLEKAGKAAEEAASWNLGRASKGEGIKYLVYNYFLENKTPASPDWAFKAAADLNARYKTDVFRVIPEGPGLVGGALGWGDEYVHSDGGPGYGMVKGTFNPSSNGTLYWGHTSDPSILSGGGLDFGKVRASDMAALAGYTLNFPSDYRLYPSPSVTPRSTRPKTESDDSDQDLERAVRARSRTYRAA
ncbi:MAG: hypothetical protein ACKVPX_03325 [Myxococcaceae bacterium]